MLSPTLDHAPRVAAQQAQAGRRIDSVDAAKAIGIVLVVLGHAPGAPAAVTEAIYSFHMPLFFFLSGCLLTPERAAAPLADSLRRSARTLLVPYLFFFALSLAYWLATRHLGARAARFAGVDWWDALPGLVTGLSSDLFVNITLWFFPCMFMCQLLYAAARRLLPPVPLCLAFAVLAWVLLGSSTPWSERAPWGLDIAWIAVVFYAAGHALRSAGPLLRQRMARLDPRGAQPRQHASGLEATVSIRLALLAALALAWAGMVALQGRVDLAQAAFGPWPLLYLPCAAAGVAGVMTLAHFCPPQRALRVLADNSLVIFPLHPLLINFASGAAKAAGVTDYGAVAWALFTVWGVAAALPVAWLLRRHAPMLLGLRGHAA